MPYACLLATPAPALCWKATADFIALPKWILPSSPAGKPGGTLKFLHNKCRNTFIHITLFASWFSPGIQGSIITPCSFRVLSWRSFWPHVQDSEDLFLSLHVFARNNFTTFFSTDSFAYPTRWLVREVSLLWVAFGLVTQQYPWIWALLCVLIF